MVASGPVQGAIRAAGEERIKSVLHAALEPFTRDGAISLSNTFLWAVGEKR